MVIHDCKGSASGTIHRQQAEHPAPPSTGPQGERSICGGSRWGNLALLREGTVVGSGGSVANLDVALTSLVGQDVAFNFVVIVNASHSSHDTVFFVNPRIVRP